MKSVDDAIPAGRVAYSRRRAAQVVDMSERHLARAIAANQLIARKAGRRTIIEASALAEWLRSLPSAGSAAA